jgi:hypothetical protein
MIRVPGLVAGIAPYGDAAHGPKRPSFQARLHRDDTEDTGRPINAAGTNPPGDCPSLRVSSPLFDRGSDNWAATPLEGSSAASARGTEVIPRS